MQLCSAVSSVRGGLEALCGVADEACESAHGWAASCGHVWRGDGRRQYIRGERPQVVIVGATFGRKLNAKSRIIIAHKMRVSYY
jgi:hypothetical protein